MDDLSQLSALVSDKPEHPFSGLFGGSRGGDPNPGDLVGHTYRYLEKHAELESGRGRDRLVRDVYRVLEGQDICFREGAVFRDIRVHLEDKGEEYVNGREIADLVRDYVD